MRIDAHHHLWQYNDRDYIWMSAEMDILRRDFLLPDLEHALSASAIDGTVAVQARQSLEESRWLLGLARTSGIVRGVVGWVPLTDGDVRRSLDELAQEPKLKAVRHVLHDEPDDDYMLREDFNGGIGLLKEYGLAYDLLVFERHLPQTLQFVDRHPGQIFVLDHIGKPRIRAGELSPWRERIRELARRENVYCKVSGLVTGASWSGWIAGQLAPYLDVVVEAFTPRRIMFGSDWPVLTLAAEYSTWVATVQSYFARLSEPEQARLWAETAVEAYRL
jgi:L-fuconolactonase